MPMRDDVEREIRHHIEERADRLVAQGWEREAALREAERRFGDPGRYRRELRRIGRARRVGRGLRETVGSALADVRYAVRGMRRRPGFTAGVILTLALGIGAAAVIFTYADALLLRPLPYRDADRLVTVSTVLNASTTVPFVMADQIEPWQEAADGLAPFALYEVEGVVRTDGAEPERLTTLLVSHDLDDMLGVEPSLGRGFTEADGRAGDRAVLTHAYWRRTGSNPAVVGRTLRLNDRIVTVVGVLPRDFKFPVAGRDLAAWLVLGSGHTAVGTTLPRLSVLARLPDGMTLETAQARMDRLAEGLAAEREARFGWNVALSPVTRWRANPEMVRGVWLLGGAVGLMLLVALTNAVNLLLFRGVERKRELALRLALGGSRWRLLRQLLLESLVLGLLAGAGAVALAWGVVQGLAPFLPQEFHFSSVYEFRIEARVLAFTFFVSVVSGTVLGMVPGVMAVFGRMARSTSLRTSLATDARSRFQQVLVTVEIALSVALLVGCGLLVNSFVRLVSTDTGFDEERIALLQLELPEHRYPTPEARAEFYRRLESDLERLPGIAGATVASGVPPKVGFSFGFTLQAEGGRSLSGDAGDTYLLMPRPSVRPDYVSTLGLRLLGGRNLDDEDVDTRNVMVNATLARELWATTEVVGRRFRTSDDGEWLEVVGVVEDVAFMGLDGREAPYAVLNARPAETAPAILSVGVRALRSPEEILLPIRRAVHRLDPDLPIQTLEPARDALVETVEKPRFLSTLMLALAGMALVLAGIGLYGVLSYAVSRRRREIGIRVSLGAEPARVRRMVLGGGLKLAFLGVVAGMAGGLALTHLVRGLLYGVEPSDPLTLATVSALMLATAAAASWVPARRATRVDPVEVLKAE